MAPARVVFVIPSWLAGRVAPKRVVGANPAIESGLRWFSANSPGWNCFGST